MKVSDAVKARRTVRAFSPERIEDEVLLEICDLSRLYACTANIQPIRFKIVNTPRLCEEIYTHIRLAGYIPGYTLAPEERPTAYILVLSQSQNGDKWQFEAGAVCTNIMLLAKEQGLDTCCIGNFSRGEVANLLGVDTENYQLLYLMAIGKSPQKNTIEPVTDGIKYRMGNGNFVVPKYDLKEILL